MPSKKMHTKKSVSKHTSSTAKASANSSPMNTSHSVEYCGVCRDKVKVSNITFVDLKVKNGTIRKRMAYMCVNKGHKWGKFVSSKSKTVGNSNNKKMVHTGGSGELAPEPEPELNYGDTGYTTSAEVQAQKKKQAEAHKLAQQLEIPDVGSLEMSHKELDESSEELNKQPPKQQPPLGINRKQLFRTAFRGKQPQHPAQKP